MTALNLFLSPEAVHLFTDAGHCDLRDMKLRGLSNKAVPLTRFNAVLATTGYSFAPTLLNGFLVDQTFSTFDDLVAGWPDFVKTAQKNFGSVNGGISDWGAFETVLAGLSESKDELVAYAMRGYSKDGKPAYEMREITRFRAPDHPSFMGHVFDPDNPAESGLELMRAQRAMKFGVHGFKAPKQGGFIQAQVGHQVVYGFCQHTTLTRAGITMRVLERWPDKFEPMAA